MVENLFDFQGMFFSHRSDPYIKTLTNAPWRFSRQVRSVQMKVSLLENRLNQAANLTKVHLMGWALRIEELILCCVWLLFFGGGMNKFAKKVWKMKMIHTKKSKLLLVIWVRGVFFGGKQMISIWVYRYILDWTCFNQRIDDVKSFFTFVFKHVHPFYGSRHIFFRKGKVCKGNFGVGSLPRDFPEEEVNAFKNVIPETTGKPFGPRNFAPQQTTRSWSWFFSWQHQTHRCPPRAPGASCS